MFFGLKYVKHDLEEIHRIIEHFFSELSKQVHTDFSSALLPPSYQSIIVKSSSTTGKLNKLGDLLKKVFVDFQELIDKDTFCVAFIDSNKIKEICDKNSTPTAKNALPSSIQKSIKELFEYLYKDKDELLEGVSTIQHYKKFLEENGSLRVCAFCCLETIPDGEKEGRANYDHYLPKAQFPFSAINLKNLVPTGTTCNQNVKGQKVVSFKDTNLTLSAFAFYPYDESFYALDVIDFYLFSKEKPTIKNKGGVWEVKIQPKNTSDSDLIEKIESWNRVFEIQERYAIEIKKQLKNWIDIFIEDKKKNNKNLKDKVTDLTPSKIKLKTYAGILAQWLFFDFLSKDEGLQKILIPISKKSINPEDFL